MNLKLLILFYLNIKLILTSNILILGVFPFNSHVMILSTLANELVNKGHNVTYVTVKKSNHLNTKLNLIINDNVLHLSTQFLNKYGTGSPHKFAEALWVLGMEGVDNVLSTKQLKTLIETPINNEDVSNIYTKSYDVIITETYFLCETIAAGFAQKYNCPIINYQPIVMSQYVASLVSNPYNPTYMVDYKMKCSSNMNFIQRLENIFITIHHFLYQYLIYYPYQDNIMRKHFASLGAKHWPYITDILQERQSLTLVDTHHVLTDPKPYYPNVIDIGGIQIKPAKPLPKDIETFMNSSGNEGVIYFALGSHINAENLGEWRINNLIEIFKNLKQNVIWKIDDETIGTRVTTNVKVGKWFPQNDILAHPNCKLFITHGGVHSTFESIYHSIPMLVIPLFADQTQNGKIASEKGYGEMINFQTFQKEELYTKLNQILYEPKYKENINLLSDIFRSDDFHPLDRAIRHIESTIKYNGSYHLKSKSLNLNWYQIYMLDVIISILLILFISFFIIYKIIVLIMRKIFKNKQNGGTKKEKKLKKKNQ